MVIFLYEQSIEDLRRAIIALEKNDVETRTRELNHALMVIGQLEASLDMERGGEVAENLQRFYHVVRSGVIEAQLAQSAAILEKQISHLVLVHGAWLEVQRATALPKNSSADSTPSSPDNIPAETSFSDWNA